MDKSRFRFIPEESLLHTVMSYAPIARRPVFGTLWCDHEHLATYTRVEQDDIGHFEFLYVGLTCVACGHIETEIMDSARPSAYYDEEHQRWMIKQTRSRS